MRLQYASFSLPLHSGSAEQEELNRFLRGHRIVQAGKELASVEGAPCWAILVEYLDGPAGKSAGEQAARGKVDYREVLSAEDFALYSRLRDARKKLAEDNGLPVYAVCTNEQLAEIARRRPGSLAECMKIGGIGQGKAGKYASALIECVRGEAADAASAAGGAGGELVEDAPPF